MRFFLIVTPGLESLAKDELKSCCPEINDEFIKVVNGGIELEAELGVGLALNKRLRIPTRILLRVTDFGCRDFPKLFKKLSTLNWNDWVPDLKNVDFQVSSHGSRLKIKNRIEETCLSARIAYLKKKGLPHSRVITGPDAEFALFIRLIDDVCFVSLDTSGERLHKRGVREQVSDAPLRETFATALLKSMESVYLKDVALSSKGISPIELVDPMMGGATFLLEASAAGTDIQTRQYSFERNTALLAQFSRSNVETEIQIEDKNAIQIEDKNAIQIEDKNAIQFASLIGYEMNVKTLDAARKNLLQEQSARRARHLPTAEVQTFAEDFFKAQPLPPPLANRHRWLVCNPPYGERIKVEGQLSDFYERMMHQMEKVAAPDYVALLIPQKVNSRLLNLPARWRFRQALKFSNGGIPVQALVYSRK